MIEAKNDADSLAYSTEKSLVEHKARLPQSVIDDVNAALAEVREKSGGEDLEGLKVTAGARHAGWSTPRAWAAAGQGRAPCLPSVLGDCDASSLNLAPPFPWGGLACVLQESIQKLSNASMKIGEALNQQTSSSSGSGDGQQEGGDKPQQ